MKKNIALVSLLSASVLATSALAAETKLDDQKNYYFQVNAGGSYGIIPRSDFGNQHSGWGSVFGAELGYKIDENVRAGFDLSYRPNYRLNDTTVENFPKNEDGVVKSRTTYSSYKVKSFTAMANIYYDILTTNNITPYITAGAGLSRNTVKENENRVTTSNYNEDEISLSYTSSTISKITTSKNSFAYKLGLGAKYAINNDFDLDLRYQYVDLGKIKANQSSVSTEEKGKLRAQEVMLGVAYKF